MTRIHPVFTPDTKGKTLEQKAEMLADAYAEGIAYWAGFIIDEIGYIDVKEMPIIIIALRAVADQIAVQRPAAGRMADEVGEGLKIFK